MRFVSDKQLADLIARDRLEFMEAIARKGSVEAVHSLISRRSFEDWRKLLDEAEKHGDKYVKLAELIVEADL